MKKTMKMEPSSKAEEKNYEASLEELLSNTSDTANIKEIEFETLQLNVRKKAAYDLQKKKDLVAKWIDDHAGIYFSVIPTDPEKIKNTKYSYVTHAVQVNFIDPDELPSIKIANMLDEKTYENLKEVPDSTIGMIRIILNELTMAFAVLQNKISIGNPVFMEAAFATSVTKSKVPEEEFCKNSTEYMTALAGDVMSNKDVADILKRMLL